MRTLVRSCVADCMRRRVASAAFLHNTHIAAASASLAETQHYNSTYIALKTESTVKHAVLLAVTSRPSKCTLSAAVNAVLA
jgi:hypothetical protein